MSKQKMQGEQYPEKETEEKP